MKNARLFLVLTMAIICGCHNGNDIASIPVDSPDCSGINNWPTAMAFVTLKNKGLLTNKKGPDKTTTKRISSESIGGGLYRQLHLTRFYDKSDRELKVITVCNVSHEECSMSDVDVFVVGDFIPGNESVVLGLLGDDPRKTIGPPPN